MGQMTGHEQAPVRPAGARVVQSPPVASVRRTACRREVALVTWFEQAGAGREYGRGLELFVPDVSAAGQLAWDQQWSSARSETCSAAWCGSR